MIKNLIKDSGKGKDSGAGGSTPKKKPSKAAASPSTKAATTPKKKDSDKADKDDDDDDSGPNAVESRPKQGDPKHKDNSLREFRRLCAEIASESSYNAKTEIVRKFFSRGTDGKAFKGDLYVWVRLLLPGVVKRIYNVQSKQLVKIFSRALGAVEEDMLEDLEAGDVAETIEKFFQRSKKISPVPKSILTVHDTDDFLEKLSKLTKEDEQQYELTKIAKKCTGNDLKIIIRLIKHDLRIQAGAKHILDGLHKDAYDAFNSSRNIVGVLDRVLELRAKGTPSKVNRFFLFEIIESMSFISDAPLDVGASLMHPVQPMLAMACKSVDMAFQKCPNGMYSEIKYDGERVQLHKKGDQFKYFSRSLKPVLPHKVSEILVF